MTHLTLGDGLLLAGIIYVLIELPRFAYAVWRGHRRVKRAKARLALLESLK